MKGTGRALHPLKIKKNDGFQALPKPSAIFLDFFTPA